MRASESSYWWGYKLLPVKKIQVPVIPSVKNTFLKQRLKPCFCTSLTYQCYFTKHSPQFRQPQIMVLVADWTIIPVKAQFSAFSVWQQNSFLTLTKIHKTLSWKTSWYNLRKVINQKVLSHWSRKLIRKILLFKSPALNFFQKLCDLT